MELQQLLERKQGRRKPRRRKMRPPTPSKRVEVWYRDRLTEFINSMTQMVIDELERPTLTDAPDTPALSITARLSRIMQRLASISVEEIASRIASGLVSRANFQNKEQTQRTYSEAFGIDLTGMLGDGAIREKMADAVRENVGLITSIQTDFINDINDINDIGEKVFGNLLEGGRSENLINIIRERGDVTLSRAKFIARDQTSKLNAELTEARSNALGLDVYEWSGTGDERERKSHFVLNGMLCKYSDPTVYSDDGGKTWKKRSSIGAFIGKPGEDYQCRCLSLPYVSWE
ncbi:TPA: phage minor head protein [Yersinia enterocolitica]